MFWGNAAASPWWVSRLFPWPWLCCLKPCPVCSFNPSKSHLEHRQNLPIWIIHGQGTEHPSPNVQFNFKVYTFYFLMYFSSRAKPAQWFRLFCFWKWKGIFLSADKNGRWGRAHQKRNKASDGSEEEVESDPMNSALLLSAWDFLPAR